MNKPKLKHTIQQFTVTALLTMSIVASISRSGSCQSAADLKKWGEECLDQMRQEFYLPNRGLYADTWNVTETGRRSPAFMWGCGVVLPALVAGSKVDPAKYADQMEAYAKALDLYWQAPAKGPAGYDVLPVPKQLDRYFDDNMWVDIALIDTFDISHNAATLARAQACYKFIISGEDKKLGGGIYWRESDRASKNTCSNGPAIVSALRLYQATHSESYLEDAKRLYAWTNEHLQDKDGLFWDNIKLNGNLDKAKYSYNTALMIRSNVMLHAITGDKKYKLEAERVATAAVKYWIKSPGGAVADGGQFAHLLTESLLYLYLDDHNEEWRNTVLKSLKYLHENVRDSQGHYGDHWDNPVKTSLSKSGILMQASVARAFLITSALLATP